MKKSQLYFKFKSALQRGVWGFSLRHVTAWGRGWGVHVLGPRGV